MRLLPSPFRLLLRIIRNGVRLALFTVLAGLLLFAFDLLLLNNKEHPER